MSIGREKYTSLPRNMQEEGGRSYVLSNRFRYVLKWIKRSACERSGIVQHGLKNPETAEHHVKLCPFRDIGGIYPERQTYKFE
jgi:hypothetical protein